MYRWTSDCGDLVFCIGHRCNVGCCGSPQLDIVALDVMLMYSGKKYPYKYEPGALLINAVRRRLYFFSDLMMYI